MQGPSGQVPLKGLAFDDLLIVMVVAAALSVLFFPAIALRLLDRTMPREERGSEPHERAVDGM